MNAATPKLTCQSSDSLLVLPDVLLHEVLSWSPNSASANALLNTCASLRSLRRDPAAAALLLLRCACKYGAAALLSCDTTCQGGSAAVVQQVLRRLEANGDVCSVHTAPLPLLQALLRASAASGNVADIHTIMGLTQPPLIDAEENEALLAAVHNGHLAAAHALLDLGAFSLVPEPLSSPFNSPARCMSAAASHPARVPLLQLLLQRCPQWDVKDARTVALHTAVVSGTADAVSLLLPLFPNDSAASSRSWLATNLVQDAADAGSAAALRLLLTHWPQTPSQLNLCLPSTIQDGRASCVAVLLDAGAAVNPADGCLLLQVLDCLADDPLGAHEEANLQVLRLLLQRGAEVTEIVLDVAEAAGRDDVMNFMIEAAGY